jgi:hypothetical protein
MNIALLAASAFLLTSVPGAAQDFGSMASDSLSSAGSFAGTVGVNSHVDQRSRSSRASRNLDAEARAGCANKARAAANLGANHPKVRRLYALCAQAGY